jgi:gliding motility-associated-like protein
MKNLRRLTLLPGLFLFFISLHGISQNISSNSFNKRASDSIFRLQQLKRAGNKNKNPLFSFNAVSFASALSRNLPVTGNTNQATTCYDSSSRFFLRKDSTTYYVADYKRLSDGNLLLSGEYLNDYDYFKNKGFLMKCDEKGNIFWTRLYDSLNHVNYSFIDYYKILELKDNSLIAAGSTLNSQTGNHDLIITRTDKNGNLLWSKIYKSRLWTNGNGSADYYYISQMIQDQQSGDVYITGSHWVEGRSVIHLNSLNGNIIWSKLYQPPYGGYFDTPIGMDIQGNELLLFGDFLTYSGPLISVYRLNKVTGDTIHSKFFVISNNDYPKYGFLNLDPLSKLNNGNYVLSGEQYNYYHIPGDTAPLYHAGLIQLDSKLNFLNAFSFRNNIESNGYNTVISVFPDGTGLFTMLDYISGYTSNVYYVQFKGSTILKQRIRHYTEGIPNEHQALELNDGATLIIKQIGDSLLNTSKVEFLKLHISDTSSQCLGVDDHSTFIEPYYLSVVPGQIDSIGENDFRENPNKTITVQSSDVSYAPGCEQVSFCDSLSMQASDDSICLDNPVLITVHKNPECRAPVFFYFDSTALRSFTLLNDSTYSLQFSSAWKGTIYGSTYGCSLVKDSVKLTFLNSPLNLDLGPDTVICPGNTITLHAGYGFASYLWQDGSSDSTFTIPIPGTYFVKTSNACGGIFEDTVKVLSHPPIQFDAGADVVKCNNDSVILTASPDFISYLWSPDYNIDSVITPSVVVKPLITTLYKVRAEKTIGCYAYDSVKVTVNTSPPINLGFDTSFCFGDNTILDAGIGFLNYAWNTGSDKQKITVRETGNYFVIGTTTEGCSSFDTLQILNVYVNPVAELDKDSTLCKGSAKQLDAGNFTSYVWNTGEKTRLIEINSTGVYSVKVTDIHNCIGNDSVAIVKLLPIPQSFLPSEASICSYGTTELSPTRDFSKYLWSNYATSKTITASDQGLYWLQVTDTNNCTARDSVILKFKDCLTGFYIPNAFTPNNNGKNDTFKPLLFGIVQYYEFSIYNRFGEVVFKTNDESNGWNGNYKGNPQDSNVFIWICKYQFKGEQLKGEKGSVILLK